MRHMPRLYAFLLIMLFSHIVSTIKLPFGHYKKTVKEIVYLLARICRVLQYLNFHAPCSTINQIKVYLFNQAFITVYLIELMSYTWYTYKEYEFYYNLNL